MTIPAFLPATGISVRNGLSIFQCVKSACLLALWDRVGVREFVNRATG